VEWQTQQRREMSFPDWAQIIDDPTLYVGKKVHVVGWRAGSVFKLISFVDGVSTLKTPTKRVQYNTRNCLYKLRGVE